MGTGTRTYPHYTVTSLTEGIRAALEKPFARIVVDGEIGGWRRVSGPRWRSVFSAPSRASRRPRRSARRIRRMASSTEATR